MSVDSADIRIAVLCGSVRPGNYTGKAAALVLEELHKYPDIAVDVIDPAGLDLPLPGVGPVSAAVREMQQKVTDATGVVFVTPEYHGSFSSVTKLIIDNMGCDRGNQGAGAPPQCLLPRGQHSSARPGIGGKREGGI